MTNTAVIDAALERLYTISPVSRNPKPKPGEGLLTYHPDGITDALVCHFTFPLNLKYVWLNGVDISEILAPSIIDEIMAIACETYGVKARVDEVSR